MPLSADKAALLERFNAALRLSNWQVVWLNADHPAHVQLINGSRLIEAWVHIWKVTPGGRAASRPLERRIQPTGIGNQFKASAGADTLILGWSDETEVFAAFDYRYHHGQIGNSSSFQTDLPTLESAAQDGIGVFSKATGELSIAARADMLGIYVEQLQTLHASGANTAELAALRQMASDPLDIESSDIPVARRKVMSTALRLLRDRRFSEKVLSAYGHRCAFCGMQLRLLDAAHILPVAHPESNDEVTNGVALCALHHRAYDMSLVTFDPSYAILVNKAVSAQLVADGRDGGLGAFEIALGPSILLPLAQASHPSPQMVAKANSLRGWT